MFANKLNNGVLRIMVELPTQRKIKLVVYVRFETIRYPI